MGATILEKDRHGLKVLRLANGEMLKLFRIKYLISSARLYSYARRFYRNAERLHVLGIPTLTPLQLYHFTDSSRTGVRYIPLPGNTLRQLAAKQGLPANLGSMLGEFIGTLHQRGIYFRSVHFGNILLTPSGQLGLIDISDMRLFARPLDLNLRMRNFRHLCGVPEDLALLNAQQREDFCVGYLQTFDGGRFMRRLLVGRMQQALGLTAAVSAQV